MIQYISNSMLYGKKLSSLDAKNLNIINLAFVGDAVYSLFVRQKLLTLREEKPNEMNKATSLVVCAEAQSKRAEELLNIMTEEEADIFRRARNAKKNTRPKHAKSYEYNNSTGLEAVLGYLYLTGNEERLLKLLNYEVKNED